jgi:hypothetical protein
MNADQIRISGSSWRYMIVILLASYAGIILANSFIMREPIEHCLPALIGATIGLLLVLNYPILRKFDIAISSDHVEGPIRSGLLTRRHTVPLHDIDISGSKTPTLTRNGYIKSHNSQRIILMGLYFSASQGNAIFEEIKKRLASQSTLH